MKKIKTLLLTATLSLSALVGTSFAANFTDVSSSHWGYDYIYTAVDEGLMSGTSDTTFNPNGTMSYGEFAVVVVNGAYGGQTIVKSTDSHWSDPYLNVLIDNGLFKTRSNQDIVDQTFGWQDQGITREDVASVICRLGNLQDSSFPDLAYDDLTQAATSHLPSAQILDIHCVINDEIMKGADGKFGVGNTLLRVEACVIFPILLEKGIFVASNNSSNNTATTTPSTGTTGNTSATTPSTTPSTNTSTANPADVVLGSGQYDVSKYTVPADTNKDGWITYAEVAAVMTALEAQYPTGSAWGSDKSYKLNVSFYLSGVGTVSRSEGCAAWAWMVSDSIFGNLPVRRVVGDLSVDAREQMQPGNVSYSSAINHWSVMTGESSTNSDWYTDCQGNVNGMTNWFGSGLYSTAQENLIKYSDILYVFTRYPEA